MGELLTLGVGHVVGLEAEIPAGRLGKQVVAIRSSRFGHQGIHSHWLAIHWRESCASLASRAWM
ncbi:hypothetical protein D3C72_2491140 [compost metagenome]